MIDRIHKRFIVSFVSAASCFSLLASCALEKKDSSSDIGLTAKPAVVRILSACRGDVIFPKGKDNVEHYGPYSYTPGFAETGFFVSGSGYIVTNYTNITFADNSFRKGEDACQHALIRNAIEDHMGLIVTPSEVEKIRAEGGSTLSELEYVSHNNEAEVIEVIKSAKVTRSGSSEQPEDGPPSSVEMLNKVILHNGEMLDFDVKEAGDNGSGEGKGKDIAVIKVETQEAPTLQFSDLDVSDLEISDEISVVSYPQIADTSDMVKFFNNSFDNELEAKEQYKSHLKEATVTEGKISNPSKSLDTQVQVIQLDVTVAGGSDGSPALDESGRVIGLMSFAGVDRDRGSSIPFAIPSETVLEFVRMSGSPTEQLSKTDELYKAGLAFYRKGDYVKAREQFEAVLSSFPSHSEADRLIKICSDKIAESRIDKRYIPLLIGSGIVLAILAAAGQRLKGRLGLAHSDGYAPEIGATSANVNERGLTVRGRSHKPRPTNMWGNMTRIFRSHTEVRKQPCITLENIDKDEIEFVLVKDEHHIGRDPDWSDLKIPEDGWEIISRHHATLRREGNGYRIYDGDSRTGSTNKTFINNEPIPVNEGVPLNDGDVLVIGQDPKRKVTMKYSKNSQQR